MMKTIYILVTTRGSKQTNKQTNSAGNYLEGSVVFEIKLTQEEMLSWNLLIIKRKNKTPWEIEVFDKPLNIMV